MRLIPSLPPRLVLALAGCLILALTGCGDPESPEGRVRAFVDAVVKSAEARQWGDFDAYLAEDYGDAQGLVKQDVLGLVTRYILANQRIYVLKRVAEIRIDDPDHAHAVVYAGLAGRPVSGVEELAGIDADVYRFELDLVATDGGAFRVQRGAWAPAPVEGLIVGE